MAETGSVPDDLMANLVQLSKKFGTTGEDLDYALLLDGLEAEREQGITIDVAYRYFGTPSARLHRRRYAGPRAIYPQHGDRRVECRIRAAAGRRQGRAHPADAAPQPHPVAARHPPRRFSWSTRWISSDCRRRRSTRSATNIRISRRRSAFEHVAAIPIIARDGDNIVRRSERMPWYKGPTVLQHLETVPISTHQHEQPARFHVQSVVRTQSGGFRGYAGYMSSGAFNRGDSVIVGRSDCDPPPSRKSTSIRTRSTASKPARPRPSNSPIRSMSSRGDHPRPPPMRAPEVADQFAAHLVWLERQSDAARPHLFAADRHAYRRRHRDRAEVRHRHRDRRACRGHDARLNDIGFCNIATTEPIAFDRLCQEPRDRRLHPDRPADRRDRRRRHGGFRALSRQQSASSRATRSTSRSAPR